MRMSDWSSNVCSSGLDPVLVLILVVGLGVLGRDGEDDDARHIAFDRERVAADEQIVGVEFRRIGRRGCEAIAGGGDSALDDERIGKASCVERVCQYV